MRALITGGAGFIEGLEKTLDFFRGKLNA